MPRDGAAGHKTEQEGTVRGQEEKKKKKTNGVDFGAEIRTDLEAMDDPAKGAGEGASSVGKADLELGKTFEHATKDHRADAETRLGGHSDQP